MRIYTYHGVVGKNHEKNKQLRKVLVLQKTDTYRIEEEGDGRRTL
jgi:hypothetical protein